MSSILCTLNTIDGNLLHLISRVMWCQLRWQQVERLLALADRARKRDVISVCHSKAAAEECRIDERKTENFTNEGVFQNLKLEFPDLTRFWSPDFMNLHFLVKSTSIPVELHSLSSPGFPVHHTPRIHVPTSSKKEYIVLVKEPLQWSSLASWYHESYYYLIYLGSKDVGYCRCSGLTVKTSQDFEECSERYR